MVAKLRPLFLTNESEVIVYLRVLMCCAVLSLLAFCRPAEAQQAAQVQQPQYYMVVRTPWYPGKNLARGLQGAFGCYVPPRYWSVPVAPVQQFPQYHRYLY